MRTLGIIVAWIAGCFATAFLIRQFLHSMARKSTSKFAQSKGAEEWRKETQENIQFEWKLDDEGYYWVRRNGKEARAGKISSSVMGVVTELA